MSEYKDIIKDIEWSYSTLAGYRQCPYSFFLKKIVADDDVYIPDGNYFSENGSFIHSILDSVFSGNMSPDEMSEYYFDNYGINVYYQTDKKIMDKTYELCSDYLANEDFKWIKGYTVVKSELEFHVEIEGYKFVGYIDLLLKDNETGEYVIVDHKSSEYPLKKDGTPKANLKDKFDLYKKQMYLYSYAVKEMFGEFPTKIMWNHFKNSAIAEIPFDKSEYEESIKWLIDTIHDIENDESFEPNEEFFFCSKLCDYRKCCEYRNM